MLVFREGRERVSGPQLVQDFVAALRRLGFASTRSSELLTDALLRAGELECSLADAQWPSPMPQATDLVAAALVAGAPVPRQMLLLEHLQVPEALTVSTPEGFAYYALHPLDFAAVARAAPLRAPAVAVVGIRSIGTTLSAVVRAALRTRAVPAERITVRPAGHPFDRELRLSEMQRSWVEQQRARAAEFWVVDEGPGLSGSSFLAVGEALVAAGVPAESITFLCSVNPDFTALRAPAAARRWQAFHTRCAAGPSYLPAGAAVSVSGGTWRARLLPDRAWPSSWVHFERLKYVSADGSRLFKFEGLGRYGDDVRQRARRLGEAGFSPHPRAESRGFVSYPLVRGRPMMASDRNERVLARIAEYCAFRALHLAAPQREAPDLARMVRVNSTEEFGEEFGEVSAPAAATRVVADGRMQPHEWLLTEAGEVLKTDGASHGDDHFYPGPADIAWDLAGVIVEWELDAPDADFFLRQYQRLTGDDARHRLSGFLLAYTMFRLGYCKMAAETLRGSEEEQRLLRDYHRYRAVALRNMRQPAAA